MKGNTARLCTTTLLAIALTGTGAAAGHAGDKHHHHHGGWSVSPGEQTVLAESLVGPLRIAAGPGKTTYVTQNFAGLLSSVDRNGVVTNLLERPDIEVGGVSTQGPNTYYTESVGGPGDPRPVVATVNVLRHGQVTQLADLQAYETANNPDADAQYGLLDTPQECLDQLPPEIAPFAVPRGGEVYSHPYATAVDRTGQVLYVADAGANAIFAVNTSTGAVSTVSVLAPVPTEVTAEKAAEFGLPECVVGEIYYSEPVPTDVEIGHDGYLYVTSLPGVPEGETAGSIVRIDPWTGAGEAIVTGLQTPTGLALDKRGNIFVAELQANRISVVPAGSNQAVLFTEAMLPADVEVDNKTLYATTNVLPAPDMPPNGMLVKIELEYDHYH